MSEHRGAITHEGERYPSPRRAVAYLDCDPPAPGHARRIGDRLYWARIPLPMELNHINVWLLDDGDRWTLVDTGMPEQVCRDAWTTLEQEHLGGRPIGRIFVTHDHPDHLGLSPWLAARHGAEVWMSAFGHRWVLDYLAGSKDERIDRGIAFVQSHGMAVTPQVAKAHSSAGQDWFDAAPPLHHPALDGETMLAGGRSWRLIETDGHCRGHFCLYDGEGEVLISGDQVLPTISPNVSVITDRPEGDPLRDFLDSLARLEAHCADGTLVLPSHGRPFYGLHRRIATVREHHLEQVEVLRAACTEPKTGYELVPVMFGRTLRGFHRFLALGETLAHLHYLWHAGQIARTVDEAGVVRFQRA